MKNSTYFSSSTLLFFFTLLFFTISFNGFAQRNHQLIQDESILPVDANGKPITRWVSDNPMKSFSTKSASILKSGRSLLKSSTTELEWPNPGSIHIDKSSESTDTEGLWKINILVEGKNITTSSDVVLVIDNSLSMSMSGSTRMADAIDAANTFVDQLLSGSTGNIRIAVVTINQSLSSPFPQTVIGFSSDASDLHSAINSISAVGYTNLQGGFHEARTLLNASSAQNKVIVFMSDGEPNKSYESVVSSSVTPQLLSCDYNRPIWDISSNDILDYLTVQSSNYGVVVGGSSFDWGFYSISEDCSYVSNNKLRTRTYTFDAGNHGLTTIYEANLAINDGYDVYTIGFDIPTGSNGESVLMSSQNKGYYPANSSNISQIYSEIGSNIAYAASSAIFTDPMSGFVVLQTGLTPSYSVLPNTSGDVVVSKGSVTFSNVGYILNDPDDPNSGNSSFVKWQINWNIGTVSESGDEMYYYVAIAPNTDPTLLYDANEQTYIDYIDVEGNPAHKQTSDDFTIPKVSGGKGSIEMHFFLVNDNGDPINSAGQVVPSYIYAFAIPQDGVVSSLFNQGGETALELNTTYNVIPSATYSSSNGKTYLLHPNYNSTQNITLTATQRNQDVWFGYTEYTCAETAETISAEGYESVTVNDIEYTASGSYIQTLKNAAGCDSVLTVNVNILEPTTETISAEGCESVTVNDIEYTASGSYIQTLKNEAGCDSILTVNVNILEPTAETIERIACDQVTINGITYDESGEYVQHLTNTAGCDSTLTILLTVNASAEQTIYRTACESYVFYGQLYRQSGVYTRLLETESGCDLTITLNLTILESTSETINATACQEYTINNETYTETGTYVQHLTNAAGCDSTLTINLTIEDNETPVAVCKDVTAQLDANGTFNLSVEDINNGSSDNCSIDTMFISKSSFTCDDLGENQVILTVVDASGNESTCTATVTIEAGDSNCGSNITPLVAAPDVLEIVICPGNNVIWTPNILSNDEGIGNQGVRISVDQLPENVTLDLKTGDLNFFTDKYEDFHLEIPYTICSGADQENCSSSSIIINIMLDTDCDGVANVYDIDDDDDGILDIHELSNTGDDIDTDGDGIVNRLDLDSDGDGIMDNVEWQQTIAEAMEKSSFQDLNYYEPKGMDSDGDGWDDRYDTDNDGIYYPAFDMDEDGTPDYLDLDTDDDFIEDAIEGHDGNMDGYVDNVASGMDSDQDGLDDAYDTFDNWFVKKDKYKNTISSNAALQDSDNNGIRDWRDKFIESQDPGDDGQAEDPSNCVLNIPDGFSPNGDNYNDYFEIRFSCDMGEQLFEATYPNAKIEIYTRWGNLVYEKESYGNTSKWGMQEAWWNGTSTNGMQIGSDKLPTGTYFYILNLNDGSDAITGSIFLNN